MTAKMDNQRNSIDFLELFQIVWERKFFILSLASVFGLVALVVHILLPSPNFTSRTYLRPITTTDFDEYKYWNLNGSFRVTEAILTETYIDVLIEREVLENGIAKFELVDKTAFQDTSSYQDAVKSFASSIAIMPPTKFETAGSDTAGSRHIDNFWHIKGVFNDMTKWKLFLREVDSVTNNKVRTILKNRIEASIEGAKRKQAHKLEDILVSLENKRSDLEMASIERLQFLKNQAALARELGIENFSIPLNEGGLTSQGQGFSPSNYPDYLRGYRVIEKEIEMLENQEIGWDSNRELKRLNQRRRSIEQDQRIKRAESIAQQTPIYNGQRFYAMSALVDTTVFSVKNRMLSFVVLSVALGGIIGLLATLMTAAFSSREDKVKQ